MDLPTHLQPRAAGRDVLQERGGPVRPNIVAGCNAPGNKVTRLPDSEGVAFIELRTFRGCTPDDQAGRAPPCDPFRAGMFSSSFVSAGLRPPLIMVHRGAVPGECAVFVFTGGNARLVAS